MCSGFLTRFTLACVVGLLLLASAASLSQASDPYWGAAYDSCGRQTYATRDLGMVKIYIARKGTTCKVALKIEREYWTAPASRLRVVNGGTGYRGYILLKRYPGWKCTSGAGAGSCSNLVRAGGVLKPVPTVLTLGGFHSVGAVSR